MSAQSEAALDNAGSQTSVGVALVNAVSRKLGVIGLAVHDAASNINAIAKQFERQAAQLQSLRNSAHKMAEANRQIDGATEIGNRTAESGQSDLEESRQAIAQAIGRVASLVDAVERIEKRLGNVAASLEEVAGISGSIEAIARQTNLLALNATIEAARANEAGRGFAVVAGEVKALSGQTRDATLRIRQTVGALSEQISSLMGESKDTANAAVEARDGTRVIENAVDRVCQSFRTLTEVTASIAASARSNLGQCDAVITELGTVEEGVASSATNLRVADTRTSALLGQLGGLVQEVATSGIPTDDSPYLNATQEMAARLMAFVEEGIRKHDVSVSDVFDEDYIKVPNTNPQQYMTRFVAFADHRLRPILDEYLTALPHVVFSLCVDVNVYAPTHNAKCSLPQRPDPAWNMTNCRNRMKHDHSPEAVAAVERLDPVLLQTFRRSLGADKYVMMKITSTPIMITGRHWGGAAIAYVLP
jgi:methyl-accepting chemotaxis protein